MDHIHVFLRDNARNIKKVQTKEKALLLVQDVDTRLNSIYLMLERLKKLRSGVWYYVANYKNDQDSIIIAKEWQLVDHIILLLEPFL